MNVITVLDAGAGEHAHVDTIGQIRKLLSKLADEGLVDRHAFCVRDYSEDGMDENAASVRELVDFVFDPNLRMPSIDACAYALLYIVPLTSASVSEFQDSLRASAQIVDAGIALKVFNRSKPIREKIKRGEPVSLPGVILLASDRSPSFGARHGITLGRAFVVLRRTYQQIVWHEVLHLCFQLVECYDETTKDPVCELSTCIMQWQVLKADPDSASWLCERQRTRLREWSERQG